jgi:quinol monooxygenase YgiN
VPEVASSIPPETEKRESPMVIVAGWIDVDAAVRDDYLASRIEGMIKTRQEPGCIEYVFSADPINAGRARLFELWESREDLDVHLGVLRSSPAPGASFEVVGREVLVYDVNSSGPVG